VYIAIVAPIKVGFGIKTPPWSFGHVLDIVMDIYFLFDLLVTFRSAYYHPKTGQLVTSARAIACTYAQGWLAIDVVSSVPLALIEGIVDFDKIVDNRVQVDDKEQSSLRLVRILRLTKLVRVFRIFKLIQRYFTSTDEVGSTSAVVHILLQILRSLKLMLGLLFLGHFGGCVWYLAGTERMYADDPSHPLAATGWVAARGWLDDQEGGTNATGGWSYDPSSSDLLFSRYVQSFFDAFTGMVIEKATTDAELLIAIVIHIAYECLYGFILGTLTSIVLESRKSTQEFEEKMNSVKEFCILNRLGPKISRPLMSFYRNLYPHDVIYDEEAFLAELPPTLRKRIVHTLYSDVIKKLPLFKTLDDPAMMAICTHLRPMVVPANEAIFREGETATAIYFIIEGTCRVTVRGIKLGYLKAGGFFGEMAILREGHGGTRVQNRSVFTHTVCNLRYLETASLELYIGKGQLAGIRGTIRSYAEKRMKQDALRIDADRKERSGRRGEEVHHSKAAINRRAERRRSVAPGDASTGHVPKTMQSVDSEPEKLEPADGKDGAHGHGHRAPDELKSSWAVRTSWTEASAFPLQEQHHQVQLASEVASRAHDDSADKHECGSEPHSHRGLRAINEAASQRPPDSAARGGGGGARSVADLEALILAEAGQRRMEAATLNAKLDKLLLIQSIRS
jgi:CRP-like cAMP-binding protein